MQRCCCDFMKIIIVEKCKSCDFSAMQGYCSSESFLRFLISLCPFGHVWVLEAGNIEYSPGIPKPKYCVRCQISETLVIVT